MATTHLSKVAPASGSVHHSLSKEIMLLSARIASARTDSFEKEVFGKAASSPADVVEGNSTTSTPKDFLALGERPRRSVIEHSSSRIAPHSSGTSTGTEELVTRQFKASSLFDRVVMAPLRRSPFLRTNTDFAIDASQAKEFERYIYSNRVLSFGQLIIFVSPIILAFTITFAALRAVTNDDAQRASFGNKLPISLTLYFGFLPLQFIFLVKGTDFAMTHRRPIAISATVVILMVFAVAEIYRELTIIIPLALITEMTFPVTKIKRRCLMAVFFLGHLAVTFYRSMNTDLNNCSEKMIKSGLVTVTADEEGKELFSLTSSDRLNMQAFVLLNNSDSCISQEAKIFPWVVFFIALSQLSVVTDSIERKSFLVISGLYDSKVSLAIQMQQELTRQAEFNKEQLKAIEELKKSITVAAARDGGTVGSDDKRLEIALDDLEFKERLGQGSFGTVWRAIYVDPSDGRATKVAVKMLNPENATEENIRRFGFEIGLHLGLTHEGIIKMVGAVMAPPKLCLVMKLATHGTLTKVLVDGTAVSRSDEEDKLGRSWLNEFTEHGEKCNLKGMVSNLAWGLAHCHALGLAHRDVKTDNCLVYSDWECVLSDFGEAKKLDSNNTSVGTPYYVAPEVFRGDSSYDKSCDVYSFSVLLGVCLYSGSVDDFFWWDRAKKLSGFVVSQKILRGWRPKIKPVFLEELPTICNLIQSCWKDNPNDRPTMTEVASILRDWRGDVGLVENELNNSVRK